jgi:uncharacterized protein (UPF0332 family)
MKAADYFQFAGKIAATYPEAASCRSALSRAYYGAFHLAKSFLDQIDSRPPRNASTHVFVHQRLSNCGHSQAALAGSLLADLYADRLDADYDLGKKQVESVSYARAGVVTAQRIQSVLEACDNAEDREKIKAGIAQYERKISAV